MTGPTAPLTPEEQDERTTPNLPAPLGTSTGAIDLDALELFATDLRRQLEDALRVAVAQLREARGTVVSQEDTYELVRRLAHAQEVFGKAASAFTAAAKACVGHIEDELILGVGEQEGVPTGRMVVPTAGAHEYVVSPKYRAGADVWDVRSILGVVCDLAVAGQPVPTTDPDNDGLQAHEKALREYANEVAGDACHKLMGLLASPKWKTTAIDALRRQIAGTTEGDRMASVLGQARNKGARVYEGVTVELEEAKARRRS